MEQDWTWQVLSFHTDYNCQQCQSACRRLQLRSRQKIRTNSALSKSLIYDAQIYRWPDYYLQLYHALAFPLNIMVLPHLDGPGNETVWLVVAFIYTSFNSVEGSASVSTNKAVAWIQKTLKHSSTSKTASIGWKFVSGNQLKFIDTRKRSSINYLPEIGQRHVWL